MILGYETKTFQIIYERNKTSKVSNRISEVGRIYYFSELKIYYKVIYITILMTFYLNKKIQRLTFPKINYQNWYLYKFQLKNI